MLNLRFSCCGSLLIVLFMMAFFLTGISALDKKEYKIYIVSDDDQKDKFVDLRNGFTESLDKLLSAAGAKAMYTVFDTKSNKANVPVIIKAIQDGQPDLIAVINSSGVFADTNITLKLSDPKYKFVSENCIPVQSGVARTWEKPGGNVTGVGVFTQFSSIIKLAQNINPMYKKVIFWTWESVKPLNEYFEAEIKAACKATGVELVEFKRLASAEDQFEFLAEMDKKGSEYFTIGGVSAWVHRDGSPANMTVEEPAWAIKNLKHLAVFSYDEAGIKLYMPAGACVVWFDLGAQMADKAIKILGGVNPGELSWSYPRKYNVMLNLAGAKLIGLQIPEKTVGGAYRVYTDFNGNFAGQKN